MSLNAFGIILINLTNIFPLPLRDPYNAPEHKCWTSIQCYVLLAIWSNTFRDNSLTYCFCEAKQLNISFIKTLKFAYITFGINETISSNIDKDVIATLEFGSFESLANIYIILVFNRYWPNSSGYFFMIYNIFNKVDCRIFQSLDSHFINNY